MSEKFFRVPNLHTHTFLCRHAEGSPDDLCKAAAQYTNIIGISDHGPFPDDRYFQASMFYDQLTDYTALIREAREKNPDMTVLSALEIEWCEDMGSSYYTDELLGRHRLDYLVGSAHYSGFNLDRQVHFFDYKPTASALKGFCDVTLKLISSGIFTIIAHPDAFMVPFTEVTSEHEAIFSEIISAAAESGVALELNANGLRGKRAYPCRRLWEMAADNGKVKVVVNSDSHRLEHLYDDAFAAAIDLADELGIKICNEEIAQKIIEGRKNE